jgi:hypothetical protein
MRQSRPKRTPVVVCEVSDTVLTRSGPSPVSPSAVQDMSYVDPPPPTRCHDARAAYTGESAFQESTCSENRRSWRLELSQTRTCPVVPTAPAICRLHISEGRGQSSLSWPLPEVPPNPLHLCLGKSTNVRRTFSRLQPLAERRKAKTACPFTAMYLPL